jgi:hypothetical protein
MNPLEARRLELLQRTADSAQQLIPFLRMKMKDAGIWTDLIEETFKRYDFAQRSAQTFASDDEKSAWEQMSDLTWLDYVVRNVHLVRTNGESEDEDMLICDVALHSHYTATIKAHSFRDLILKGQEFEQTRLKRPSQKGETDGKG